MIKTIVFMTDFSAFSKEALRYTVGVAKKVKARIIGVYALKIPSPVYSIAISLEKHEKELKQEAKAKLESFFRSEREEGIEIDIRLCDGLPEQVLNRLAREVKADLIVVAKHSRSTLERFFMGSTTERIVRESRFPVLVLPDEGPRSMRWKPILCATDFSHASKDALHFSIQLVRNHGGELSVIHVVDLGAGMESIAGERLRTQLSVVVDRARERLEEEVNTHGAPKGTETLVVEGKPAATIVEEAEKGGSDLLIVGERGHGVLERMVIGSTTNAVLRRAHVPVIVVPAGYMV